MRTSFSTRCHFTYSKYCRLFHHLPITHDHIVQRCDDGWREVLITSGPDPAAPMVLRPDTSSPIPTLLDKAPNFRQVLSPSPSAVSNLLGASSPRFANLPVGTRIEVSPSAFKVARRIGELLQSNPDAPQSVPGCALIVDYGAEKTFGYSFRVSSLSTNGWSIADLSLSL